MRILASVHLYLPTHNCGSEAMLHQIFKYLISKGHDCRVLLHMDRDVETPYTYEGVEVFGSKIGQRVDAYQWGEVVLTHLDYTAFTLLMARSAERPMVQIVHNDILYNAMINAGKNVSAIYNSQWIADKLNYPIAGTVFHPPCDYKYYDVGDDRGDAITLISLNAMKGGYFFRKLAMAMPERKFIGVVGSYDSPGPEGPKQEVIIDLLRELPNVTIIQNSPDILSVYRQTRILLMPSYYESWGRTATEAMCSGIPVICTPTPGLKENCQDAAIYVGKLLENPESGQTHVDIGKVEDWIKAIRKLDKSSTYSKYSLLCRERSRELDPVKELEQLEKFLINARQSYH